MTLPVLGVDLGGTRLRVAAAHAGGRVYAEHSERVRDLRADGFARRVRELAGELCPDGTSAVAVGLPAPVAADGAIGPLINRPGLNDAPLAELLQEQLAVPVVVENDVNLAALGEQRRGRSPAPEELVFIAVGTGVGMGIVVGGRIIRGAHGGAGELGALPLAPDRAGRGPRRLGPLEAVAGGAGLAQHWSALTGRPSDGRDVYAAAAAGDAEAVALLDDQAQALAMGVRAVEALLDPDLFLFGGGIGARSDVYARVRDVLAGHGTPVPELALSTLGERAGAGRHRAGAGDGRTGAHRRGRRLMFLDVLMRRTVYLDRRLHLSVQLGGSDSLAGLLGEHEGQQLHGRGGLPHGQ